MFSRYGNVIISMLTNSGEAVAQIDSDEAVAQMTHRASPTVPNTYSKKSSIGNNPENHCSNSRPNLFPIFRRLQKHESTEPDFRSSRTLPIADPVKIGISSCTEDVSQIECFLFIVGLQAPKRSKASRCCPDYCCMSTCVN